LRPAGICVIVYILCELEFNFIYFKFDCPLEHCANVYLLLIQWLGRMHFYVIYLRNLDDMTAGI